MAKVKKVAALLGSGVVAAVGVQLGAATSASASSYDGAAASAYADQYWNSISQDFGLPYSNDCAGFVSRALYHGGVPFHGNYYSDPTDDTQWFRGWGASGWRNTHSWSVALDLKVFLVIDSNVATYEGGFSGPNLPAVPDNLWPGDPVFYAWQGDLDINHTSIKVGNGTDSHGVTDTDYVDQHTNNRYHYEVSLHDVPGGNIHFLSETVYLTHIN